MKIINKYLFSVYFNERKVNLEEKNGFRWFREKKVNFILVDK